MNRVEAKSNRIQVQLYPDRRQRSLDRYLLRGDRIDDKIGYPRHDFRLSDGAQTVFDIKYAASGWIRWRLGN
jgi:hypothetical protein